MKFHLITVKFLYLLTLTSVIFIIAEGWDYYRQPLVERPHHERHSSYKPSGNFGHGLGIIGSTLIMLLFLYSARKRIRMLQRLGNIRYWLNYHIWMGVTGPILIIFHTTFKVGGIIAISFWSMIAVAVSGVLGRYIYVQIPRSVSGTELSVKDVLEQEHKLLQQLSDTYNLDENTVNRLKSIANEGANDRVIGGWRSVWYWVIQDISTPFVLRRIRLELKQIKSTPESFVKEIVKTIRKATLLRRRVAFLDTSSKLLHNWHIIHKPFAIVMVIIMFVHIIVAITFGYTWKF